MRSGTAAAHARSGHHRQSRIGAQLAAQTSPSNRIVLVAAVVAAYVAVAAAVIAGTDVNGLDSIVLRWEPHTRWPDLYGLLSAWVLLGQRAICLALGLGWLTPPRLASVGAGVAASVGLTTLYLGTHWLSDVLAGWLARALVLLALPASKPVVDRLEAATAGYLQPPAPVVQRPGEPEDRKSPSLSQRT